MPEHSLVYDFPEADSLKEEFRLIRLDDNFSYTTERPHRHNYFELFYFTRGGGDHLIDFRHYPINEGSLHIVLPGALHLVRRTAGSAGYVLLFTKQFLYSISDFTPSAHMKLWREKAVFPLSADEDQFVRMSIDQMQRESESDRPYQQAVLGSLLQMTFILMYRQAGRGEERHTRLTERFFDFLETRFLKGDSASHMAGQLNCSLTTLNRALASNNYASAQQCINERKILEAQRLLIHTDWTIKEVAYHLQFTDPDYFGKLFKQVAKLSPSDFRSKNK